MKIARWVMALALVLGAASTFAAEWTRVGSNDNEVVFVDRGSIYESGGLKRAQVLRSYSTVQTIGDTAFPHKSEILLYAFRCEDRSLAFQQWTMTAGEIGTGETVWAGQIDEPALYKDPSDPVVAGMFATVCSG